MNNIEPVARAICERDVRCWKDVSEAEIPNLVNRYWQVVAAKMMAGLIDDDGQEVPHTIERGLAAWDAWLDERASHRSR
ncbi:MAG: hypothetical protein H7840_18180 [Alphaproteobacteria bacterium]